MTTNKELDDLVEQILDVIGGVSEGFGLLLEAGMGVRALDNVRQAAREGAEVWARVLSNPADDNAPFVANNLLKAAFGGRPPAEFWRSPLGQLLIARDAFPAGPISRSEAAAALGITIQGARKRWEARSLARYRDPQTRKETTGFMRESVLVDWRRRQSDRDYAEMQRLASVGAVDIGMDSSNERPRRR